MRGPVESHGALLKASFAATIFTGSLLLFAIQPLIAKQILPWFGGSAGAWATCLVFFQSALLIGYAYSHWTTRLLSTRGQVILHLVLLAASTAFLPAIPAAAWKPAGDEEPVFRILGLLGATIGLPYFLLATTGPLVQAWFTRAFPGGSVYRLFALSNAGSLVALLAYPVLLEPALRTGQLAYAWSVCYTLFIVCCAAVALGTLRRAPVAREAPAAGTDSGHVAMPDRVREQLLWAVLAALGSFMLLAVTTHLTQDVASVPLLWLAPLTLYLLSFIVCFERHTLYQRRWFLIPLAISIAAMAWALRASELGYSLIPVLSIYLTGFFVCCMFYHGELAAIKPAPRHLTRFYLMIALGGAVGGLLVGVGAPLVLPGDFELGAGLVMTGLLAAVLLWPRKKWLPAAALLFTGAISWLIASHAADMANRSRIMTRSFYGALRIEDFAADLPARGLRRLYSGTIVHGEQFIDAGRRREVTAYYGPDSGIGMVVRYLRAAPARVGVIGLGAGTMAAWGKPGDSFRFYEINPQVVDIARSQFSFLADTPATVEITVGDARLSMEREPPQGFDLIVVDAFSGDAIPVHLLTREAFGIYRKHLKRGGILAVHVSNNYLDLAPVVHRIAEDYAMQSTSIADRPVGTDTRHFRPSDWILVTVDTAFLLSDRALQAGMRTGRYAAFYAWTDDFTNLLRVLK